MKTTAKLSISGPHLGTHVARALSLGVVAAAAAANDGDGVGSSSSSCASSPPPIPPAETTTAPSYPTQLINGWTYLNAADAAQVDVDLMSPQGGLH